MPIKDSKELFLAMLSDLRHGAEHSTKIFKEMSEAAQDPDVKEALQARVFVSDKVLGTLDECFKMIGQKPLKATGRLHDLMAEEFRRELAEIQSGEAKRLFILAKANQLVHFRIGEYTALIAAADLTGHYGVGVLLESALSDKLVFVERTRRLIRERIKQKMAA
jgi:ferritin-like metal-binding protein YciE